jgi:carbamoyl-phosphate synthase large subunit
MAIDRTFGAALNKALRGLEQAGTGPLAESPAWTKMLDAAADGALSADGLRRFLAPSDERLWRILALLRRGVGAQAVTAATGIAPWFVAEMARNVALETEVRRAGRRLLDADDPEAMELLATAKRAGFGDADIGRVAGTSEQALRSIRDQLGLRPGYAMVDTSAAEFAAETPYFYSTYAAAGSDPEVPPVARPAAVVVGSGPVRIGQGIEFDYCAVHAAQTLRRAGWSAVLVNSNPETVSTDFDASTRLYFESLDHESVLEAIGVETAGRPPAAMVAFGGQTPLGLAHGLVAASVPLLGSDLEAIDQTEDRRRFALLLERLGIPQPDGGMAHSAEEAFTIAERVGYPVIVRPSFVIGGLAIDVCWSPDELARQLDLALAVDAERPVRIDRYLEGIEIDVDAVSDGDSVLVPGLLEHVERAGVHSGDSIAVFPPRTIGTADQRLIVATLERVARELGVRGLLNAQFVVRDDGVYLLEVNPRASRTVPFLSKVTGVPMVAMAVEIALGATLGDLGWGDGLLPVPTFNAVKAPAFSTAKLRGADPTLGPFMQSTGEVIGIHADPRIAMAKALRGAALVPASRAIETAGASGSGEPALALLSLADRDKPFARRLASALQVAGYMLAATAGTAGALRDAGFAAERVAKLGDEATGEENLPLITDVITSGRVQLVVNTPTPRPGPVRDAAYIRHAAISEGILCLTAIETAIAAAEALDPSLAAGVAEVRSLQSWVPRRDVAGDEPAAQESAA